jgi:hypothetical protein
MSIETICTGCSRKLRVADEHAGKKARCPSCGTIYSVPASSFAQEPDASFEQPDTGSSVYPPPSPGGAPVEGANPFARDPGTAPAGASFPHIRAESTRFQRPHRGGMILALGIMSLCCNICLIPGICAWMMGQSDLSQMTAGRMDPRGRGMTQAGMILGIIGTILGVLGVIFQIFLAMADDM